MADKIKLEDVTPDAMAAMVGTSSRNIAMERCLRDAMRLADEGRTSLEGLGNNEQGRSVGISNLTFADNYDMFSNVSSLLGSAIAEQARNHESLNKICNSKFEPEVLAEVVKQAETRDGGGR